jgi:phospholipid/cholesterol/gamma-HCH transport system substrate-binding protein
VSRTREAVVGLVIVAALVLTAAGTLWLQGTTFGGDRRDLEAVFFQVGQIMPGNGVKLRGVQVGRVDEIVVEPGGQLVRIRLEIDQAVTLPEDPVVILSPESFFGDWQAEILARESFPFATYPVPAEDGTLPGHALPDISQLTATAQRISDNLGVLTDRFGIAFSEETARDIASLISNVENVTTRLSDLVEQQAVSFAEVTDGVQQATVEIGSAAEQVRTTFADVSGILARAEIDSTLANLAVVSSNLRSLSSELSGTNVEVRELAARIDSTFHRAQTILTSIESGEGTVGRLLSDTSMAAELENTLTELAALLQDIRENPNRYVRLSIF